MQQSKNVKLKILFMGMAFCWDSAGSVGDSEQAYLES